MLLAETLRQNLADLAAIFTAKTGISTSGIGRASIRDSKFLPRVASGEGFTVQTYDRVVLWLSENWPESAVWPEHIDRPVFKDAPAPPPADQRIAS